MLDVIFLLSFAIIPLVLLGFSINFIRECRSDAVRVTRSKLVVGNLLILMTLLSTALLPGEIYFRYFYDSTDSFGLTKTTKRWFERHFKRNQTGFRDSLNYLPTPPPDTRRISFVGDSFTVGHGIENVEDRFANQVRTLCPQHEIHVLAECGWDTDMHIQVVNFLPQSGYEVDVVLLAYCLNDISDITPQWQEILDRLYNNAKPNFLCEHSYLFDTIHARIRMAREPEIRNYYGFVREAYTGRLWETQRSRLQSIRDTVASSGGQLMVVTFPFLHEISVEYSYGEIHEQLDAHWKQLNVPHLDLLPMFLEHRDEQLVLSEQDAHPSIRAHELAGVEIAAFIDQQLKAGPVLSSGPVLPQDQQ